jgi:hypothetical protein
MMLSSRPYHWPYLSCASCEERVGMIVARLFSMKVQGFISADPAVAKEYSNP